MAICKIELDQDTYNKLVAVALREWRPPQWQAEWMLREAIIAASREGVSDAPVPVTCQEPSHD
jgi:hypothetical protein